jgi:hypothetical protein
MRARPLFETWFDELELLLPLSKHKRTRSRYFVTVLAPLSTRESRRCHTRRAIGGISGVNTPADCDSSRSTGGMHAGLVDLVLACELDLVKTKTKPA